MQDEALDALASLSLDAGDAYTLCLFRPTWHQGVVGIVASRLKDRFHRATIVFARGSDGELKGSGRSIAGFHLRDALDLVSKREPGLIRRFGGHAFAAGLSIDEAALPRFAEAFERVARASAEPRRSEPGRRERRRARAGRALARARASVARSGLGTGIPAAGVRRRVRRRLVPRRWRSPHAAGAGARQRALRADPVPLDLRASRADPRRLPRRGGPLQRRGGAAARAAALGAGVTPAVAARLAAPAAMRAPARPRGFASSRLRDRR